MATNGTEIGVFQGASLAAAFTNPNGLDILQVINFGGTVVYNLTSAGVANTNPASPTATALFQRNGANSLALAFPGNSVQQLDLLQVIKPNGGAIVFRVDYLGATHTS